MHVKRDSIEYLPIVAPSQVGILRFQGYYQVFTTPITRPPPSLLRRRSTGVVVVEEAPSHVHRDPSEVLGHVHYHQVDPGQ